MVEATRGAAQSEGVHAVRVRIGRPGRSMASEDFPTACAAPSIQLRFDPNGLVTTCCKSLQPLGHVTRDRLADIWSGALRAGVEQALLQGDFSQGCQRCAAEIDQEGREVSYAAIHDQWAGHLGPDPQTRRWPVRMEFNLSNACNLQCVQCDGDSSSSIRTHREHRPPLPQVYGDEFFAELAEFLPHLGRAVFAGGEPFLGPENFRVWDMILEAGLDLDCVVVTNATQWTPRIEALLERLPMSFIFSLDGITAPTYEAIRVGADFDRVMANVERYRSVAARHGTTVSVNHCLMPANAHEFADLLLWAEQRDLHVDVSVVRTPAHASIANCTPERIAAMSAELQRREPAVRPRLDRNRDAWDAEVSRLAAWAAAAASGQDSSRTVVFFRCAGIGPCDDLAVRTELARWAADGAVHSVAVGPDDLIRSAEVSFAPAAELVGHTVHHFTKAVVALHGEMHDYRVVHTDDDVVWAEARFGTTPARIATAAVRDAAGWAEVATINVAFGAGETSGGAE